MLNIGMYIKLGLVLLVLAGGLSIGWYVNKIVDDYNDKIAEMALLQEEREELIASLNRAEAEKQAMRDRMKRQSDIAKERELLLGQLRVDSTRKELVIEEYKDEECVMHPVPAPIVDGLLQYAKDKNNNRN